MTTSPPQRSRLDRIVDWCFRHWLTLANGAVLLYGGLPWLAPFLVALGYTQPGALLFRLYTPFCHQRPAQSFFLLGHQVAFCHREAAMYTALFAGGLIFALVREAVRPIRLRTMGLLLLPMAIDGTTHILDELVPFVALRSSENDIGSFNWWLRMVTGVLFAVAVVLGVYPRLDRELRRQVPHTPSA